MNSGLAHECSCGGCGQQACDCCSGVQRLTPQRIHNRPGLTALEYRVGTQARFYASMQARLSTMEVDGLAADGQTPVRLRPLSGLTTRGPDDFSLGLLDAWASVGDVLSFYQERIANEGYLPSATERRSVLELARLVGYRLRPGVAASTYLAYSLDDNQAEPVSIPAGARSQSVPGPDEQAQFFETSEELTARREWNDLRARRQMPQHIDLRNVMLLDELQVSGVNSGLRPGDKLLFVFSDDGADAAVRVVDTVDTRFEDARSAVRLKPLPMPLQACVVLLVAFMGAVEQLPLATSGRDGMLERSGRILADVRLGRPNQPQFWAPNISDGEGEDPPPVLQALLDGLEKAIGQVLEDSGNRRVPTTNPETFVRPLLAARNLQPRNSLALPRSLARSFGTPQLAQAVQFKTMAQGGDEPPRGLNEYADAGTQLLLNFAPVLREGYYAAWSGASLNDRPPPLRNVYALRARNALFGATAGKLATYYNGVEKPPGSDTNDKPFPAGTLKPQDKWEEWTYDTDESDDNAFLEQANDNLEVGGYVLWQRDDGCRVMRIDDLATAPRTAYGLSGPTTRLTLKTDDASVSWRSVSNANGRFRIAELRRTQFYLQSEALPLAQRPIRDDVAGDEVQLDGLYKELSSGRWVIVTGERADIAEVKGVRTAELMMIAAVRHGYDPLLPGDTAHTTLSFATGLAYRYRRASVILHGNVVQATQGATTDEVLGSGDGAQALQSFSLKQPPLTFVAAPTAAGAASTLQVRVNDVSWPEVDSLSQLGADGRGFVTHTADDGSVQLTFGNGRNGLRLPTGVQNIKARYRSGLGPAGNVRAGQVSLLQTRPQGVKGVINPLRASGGAGRESRDLARENAPLSVLALERLVSVSDYADFARRFAGIAKASAVRTSDGARELVCLTIAGIDDAPIDTTSDLYRHLLLALQSSGDADLPLKVFPRELIALVLSANIQLLPDYHWEPVAAAVRAHLLAEFGFNRRRLGQPALRCEIIAAIQGVSGVAYVDLDAFGGVASLRFNKERNERELISQVEIAEQVVMIAGRSAGTAGKQAGAFPADKNRNPRGDVPAFPGGRERNGPLRAAELAIFVPGVPDTITLNQRS